MDPVLLLSRVVTNTATIVSTVKPDQLDLPTPCTEWSVRDLLNHVVAGHHWSAAVVNGTTPGTGGGEPPDLIGDDPAAAYAASSRVLLDAFSAPGALERTCATPTGDMPGAAWINFPTFDTYVHGWDLARATGAGAVFPDEVTGPVLGFVRAAFVMPEWPVAVLGEPIAGHDSSPPMAQLVAYLGRRPGWSPPTAA
jgi:uncharacterized protein (TIGR03086 family)